MTPAYTIKGLHEILKGLDAQHTNLLKIRSILQKNEPLNKAVTAQAELETDAMNVIWKAESNVHAQILQLKSIINACPVPPNMIDKIYSFIPAPVGSAPEGTASNDRACNDPAKFEELKQALFKAGHAAIEDFVGYNFDPEEDKDVTENRMDQAWDQTPWEDLKEVYNTYGIHIPD